MASQFVSLTGTQMRILQLLQITRRPLHSDELRNALGLVASEGLSACAWLIDNGYIERRVECREGRPRKEITFWFLADKGRRAARNGAD